MREEHALAARDQLESAGSIVLTATILSPAAPPRSRAAHTVPIPPCAMAIQQLIAAEKLAWHKIDGRYHSSYLRLLVSS